MTRHLLALTLAASVLTACSGTTPAGGTGESSADGATDERQTALAVGKRFAQCGREHGQPDFPDPVIRDGKLDFPARDGDALKRALEAVQKVPECGKILEELPASMKDDKPAVDAADMSQLLLFAQCVRRNGIPEWPDPKSDGTFPVAGTPLEAEGKSQRWLTAQEACKQHWDRGISIS
ncbi:hypothetical protein [Microbispora sp. H10670]|uniref:hypothetical protein n=1 Tax=Microbispora sp. H10670 TaxID=2729108 RepID=UPI0015FF0DAC|nr:hypothetical protein [Microbispora sp. H10670]